MWYVGHRPHLRTLCSCRILPIWCAGLVLQTWNRELHPTIPLRWGYEKLYLSFHLFYIATFIERCFERREAGADFSVDRSAHWETTTTHLGYVSDINCASKRIRLTICCSVYEPSVDGNGHQHGPYSDEVNVRPLQFELLLDCPSILLFLHI